MSTSKVEPQSEPLEVTEKNAETKEAKPAVQKREKSLLDSFLQLISSVKFGISLLVILMIFSMIGTFVVQQDTSDFAKFFASLTPAEIRLYEMLGFFDIYHSWYFNLLLLTLSLNIILASIDRAPGYWHFFTQPKISASESYMRHQQYHTQVKLPGKVYSPELIKNLTEQSRKTLLPRWVAAFGPLGNLLTRFSSFRMRVTEGKDGATTVFVERGVWNRLAFCAVHVALLMILLGWFVGNRWGHKGVVTLAPGEASSTFISPAPNNSVNTFRMPFRLVCYDIEQDLVDSKKPDLSPSNTLDWFTRVVFEDSGNKFEHTVHLNNPVDFRGYRFFQASFDPNNSAREVTLMIAPKDGQSAGYDVTLTRPGTKVKDNDSKNKLVAAGTSALVPGIGKVQWKEFYPDFRFVMQKGQEAMAFENYMMPAAEVEVTMEDGTTKSVYAFSPDMLETAKSAPMLADKIEVGGYYIVLKDYEKVSRAHTLQVQYDPGVDTIYGGCAFLVFTLLALFFTAHERIWVFIKPGDNDLQLYFAGNTNRNRPAFEIRYNTLLGQFQELFKQAKEIKNHKPEDKNELKSK